MGGFVPYDYWMTVVTDSHAAERLGMTGNAKYRITDSHAAKRLGMTGNAKYRITDSHAAERLGMTGWVGNLPPQ